MMMDCRSPDSRSAPGMRETRLVRREQPVEQLRGHRRRDGAKRSRSERRVPIRQSPSPTITDTMACGHSVGGQRA